MTFIGIEIGGTKLQLVAGTGDGTIVERQRATIVPTAGAAGIRSQIEALLPGLLQRHRPRAIGVGFGGPVDWKTGLVCCSHQVVGWHDFPLGQWLAELGGLPVVVDNDANVAALGEALHGAGRGADPVFWVNMGSGVGGGVVVGGRIYHGAKPGEVEIGHVRLDKSGVTVESRCSGWAVDGRIRDAIRENPGCSLARRVGGMTGGEARHLAAALADGDGVAERLLADVADDLAFGLSHAVHLFHPEVIVVGGGLALVGEPLRAAIAGAIPQYVMDAFQPGPRVVLAGLREDPVPVGSLCLAAGHSRSV